MHRLQNKTRLKTIARQSGTFKAQGNEIMLYGVIGSYWEDLDAQKIVKTIKEMTGDITVKINSPGGDVFDGIAIMNALKEHSKDGKGKVSIVVDALAASIASVIATAGDELIMSEGSYLMIHNPWTIALGDAAELEQVAGVLRQIGGSIAKIYARKTGKEAEEMQALMDAETWIDAQAAVEMKLADRAEGVEAASVENFDLTVFNNVPEPLRAAAKINKPSTVRDLERVLHNSGYSRAEAKAVAAAGFGALKQRDAGEEFDSEKLLAALENRDKAFKTKTAGENS